MDVSAFTGMLGSALPFLLGVGEDVAERAKASLGEGVWMQARKLWDRLRGKIDEEPGARAAVEHLAEHPDDSDAQAALAFFIRRILAADPEFERALEADWAAARVQTTAIASAERAAATIGHGNIVITGDRYAQDPPRDRPQKRE